MTKYIYDEKTAPSAPICIFEDGADGIPTKSLVVTIPPTLSGASTIEATKVTDNLVDVADISGSMTSAYFYNIGTDFTLTAGVTYKIAMVVNSTVTPFAVSVGVGDNAYRYDIYNTGINNENGLVEFEFTVEASHITTWNKLWIRAPRYSAPSEPATPTTCTFTITNIILCTNATVCTANLGQTIHGGQVNIINGTGKNMGAIYTITSENVNELTRLDGHRFYIHNRNTHCIVPSTDDADSLVCDKLKSETGGSTYDDRCFINASGAIRINTTSEYATTSDFLEDFDGSITFAFILDTSYYTDFTFEGQEIPTTQGYNAFWSEQGDTEVTYYIQIPVEEKYIIGGEILSDIADAIREKKETASPILTEDMADEIRSIEMGGSDLLDLASQSTFDFTDDTYKTSALTIPDRMFNNNQRIRTVNISGIKTVESYAFIQCKATSLSFPDVETIGYQAFFQCRGASDVPLSIPNVVTIGEEAFKEAYVCGESASNRFLDISKCVSIGHNAFRSTRINGFKMDSVETLGNNPWFGSWFSMTTVVFPKLKTAHEQMCRGVNFTNLVIGPDWESCGGGFAGYDMDWRNKYVYVYATTPPTMGGDFSLWKPPVAFYVPAESVDAYKAAPYWSQYASIILPLPSDHLTIDTWL